MTAPKPGPSRPDNAYVVEVRSAPIGTSFRIDARHRVLGWQREGDVDLPVILTGPVSRAAFLPSARGAGLCLVEFRDAEGRRHFMLPVIKDCPSFDERGLRHLLRSLDRGTLAQAVERAEERRAEDRTRAAHSGLVGVPEARWDLVPGAKPRDRSRR